MDSTTKGNLVLASSWMVFVIVMFGLFFTTLLGGCRRADESVPPSLLGEWQTTVKPPHLDAIDGVIIRRLGFNSCARNCVRYVGSQVPREMAPAGQHWFEIGCERGLKTCKRVETRHLAMKEEEGI